MSHTMVGAHSPSDESVSSADIIETHQILNSPPECIISTGASSHLVKSSSSPSLPALLLPHHSTRNVLSLVRGESDDHAKAVALSKALADEVSPLTSAEQELVRETWTVLETNLADNGIALYTRLFEVAPEAKGLFAFREDEENPLHKDPTMRLHATEVLRSLGLAACRVGQSMRVGGVLENLGRRHLDYGATPEMYDVIKTAFLWVVERALGEGCCPEVLTAWSKAYDNLANAMKRGHQAIVEERNRTAAQNGSPTRPPRSSLLKKPLTMSRLGLNKLRSFGNHNRTEKGRTWHGATQYAAATMNTSNV